MGEMTRAETEMIAARRKVDEVLKAVVEDQNGKMNSLDMPQPPHYWRNHDARVFFYNAFAFPLSIHHFNALSWPGSSV